MSTAQDIESAIEVAETTIAAGLEAIGYGELVPLAERLETLVETVAAALEAKKPQAELAAEVAGADAAAEAAADAKFPKG